MALVSNTLRAMRAVDAATRRRGMRKTVGLVLLTKAMWTID
jgi:hypothetical protein